MIKCILFILSLFGWFLADAQQITNDSLRRIGVCDADGFCEPGIKGMPRPKGFSIIQENLMDYKITTKVRDSNTAFTNEIQRNKELEVNLRFPIVLKDNHNIIAGLEYKEEEFGFERPNDSQNEFVRDLENKALRKFGLKLYYSRSFVGKHYIYSRTSFSLNGDLVGDDFHNSSYLDHFRFSFSTIYGTKVNGSKTYGFGLSFGYNFGELSAYPIFYYNKQWNDKWGLELRLPIKTELRYFLDKKNLFYFTNRLWGDNYILRLNSVQQDNAYLGIASYRSLMTYEREIYDFLWFTVSAGVRFNINFDVSDQDDFINNRDPLIENDLAAAPMFRFGIFIVPPRKMMENK